jgi:membrane protease YdiL (CAAX protease family)
MVDLETSNGLEAHLDEPSRQVQFIELAVFLFLIVPSMVVSFFTVGQSDLRFAQVAISSVLNDLALLSLVLYFIWRNHEPIRRVGWSFSNLTRDIAWGLVLFPPVIFGGNLLESVLHQAGFSAPSRLPAFLNVTGPTKVVVGFIIVAVVAVVEETIFRGYLILRFKAVTRQIGAAVLLSSLVFSLGHGYEGLAGTISVFVLGVVFSLVYLWRKSLVTPIVIHFLTDFTSIVLAPS